jgi:AbrB family looped-hinge helix DNA binding protein
MQTAILSNEFHWVIPKTIRDELNLRAGQRFTLPTQGGIIEMVPLRSIEDARGLLKGADPTGYRDREDRL